MAAGLAGYLYLLRLEYSLARGEFNPETHRQFKLQLLSEAPGAFRTVLSLKLAAMVLVGLYLASWARALRDEKPYFTQAALYFLGLGVTLEGLAWTQAVYGLPALAAWYEETEVADQAVPFRLFNILQGEQNLLSRGLALGFLCAAGLLLGTGARSSKHFPRPLGALGQSLAGAGLALALSWHLFPVWAAWSLSALLALLGLAYMGYAVKTWFQYPEEDEGD